MSNKELYGKRKKKQPSCANPLFMQWLKEWREEAADKGIKTQFVYGKAMKSLQRYPLLLRSGKDCKILENFGDKICKMLDDKLAEHIAVHGTIMPVTLASNNEVKMKGNSKPKSNTKASKAGTTGKPATCTAPRREPADGGIEGMVMEGSDEDAASPPAAKRPRPRSVSGDREYIPAYRSGPYAILLTLYRSMQIPNSRGFMTKAELVREAQPLADKSFSIPDAGSRYTSWSSMGTLIKKGLVLKESSPAKFYITDAGCQLAHRLEAVADGRAPEGTHSGRRSRTSGTNTLGDAVRAGISEANRSSREIRQVRGTEEDLEFSYVSDSGEKVTQKDLAQVLIDDEIGIGFLVQCNYRKLLSSNKIYKLDTTRPLGDKVYAYLQNKDAPEEIGHAAVPKLPSLNLDDKHIEDLEKCQPKRAKTTSKSRCAASTSTAPAVISIMGRIPQIRPSKPACPVSVSKDMPANSQDSQDSIPSISSASSAGSLPVPDFVLTPGSFEIVLCIDNQEFYGGGKTGSKNMLPDLIKNGVNCDLRKLQVGDILWIAREKTAIVPGQLGQPKAHELVLNYVIERKRMDDLVHSCTDGRLPDQKFRLKHCGIRHAIFLVENYGSMQHFSMPEERLKQTITNLQVIDGFQVKRTRDNKETVAYLTVMTRLLQSSVMHKTLYACSREDVDNYDVSDTEERLMTFEVFNQGSVKSKVEENVSTRRKTTNLWQGTGLLSSLRLELVTPEVDFSGIEVMESLTVREMFGKQIIQIYGMSAEKAKAVTDIYPTLQSLLQAYNRCGNEKEKEGILSNIKSGKSLRNLGAVQSKLIYQLYCTSGSLT